MAKRPRRNDSSAKVRLDCYYRFYNSHPAHPSSDRQIPAQVQFESLPQIMAAYLMIPKPLFDWESAIQKNGAAYDALSLFHGQSVLAENITGFAVEVLQ